MEKVYLSYTREALDREYEHAHTVPDMQGYLARSREESARLRASLPGRFDVAYGDGPDHLLDIYFARGGAANGLTPAVVFFHGGRWKAGNRAANIECAETFTAAGAQFISVEFSPVPSVSLEAQIDQCRDAVAWIWRNAPALGIDPARLFVTGKSSGAHLAAMALVNEWRKNHGVAGDVIAGALLISGIYDLEPVRLTFRNDWLSLDEATARRLSPIHSIPPAAERVLPVIIGFGCDETAEFRRQSTAFADAWETAGQPCQFIALDGHHHFSTTAELTDPGGALMAPMLELMGLAKAGDA